MILVVGGSGDLGSRIVRRLRDGGQEVRCLVRPDTDVALLRQLGAEVVRGTSRTPRAFRRRARERKPSSRRRRRLPGCSPAPSIPASTRPTRSGWRRSSGPRKAPMWGGFVYVSYAGADSALGMPLERAKVATEKRLARSPMRSVVVRPDAFQEIHLAPIGRFDIHAGKVAVFGKGDTKRRWVATEDVAALVAAVVVEDDPPDIVTFGGPEAISRNEAIAIAEQATGKKVKVQRMPRAAARLGMRLLDRPNPAMATIFGTGLMQDLLEVTWDDAPLRERGITPRSASDWIKEQTGAAS